MKIASVTAALIVAVMFIFAGVAVFVEREPVHAQAGKGFEYAYIVKVNHLENYSQELAKWSGTEKDKQYLGAHVFAYEQGETVHAERLNSLMLLNKLASDGWELVDAQSGVLRRAK